MDERPRRSTTTVNYLELEKKVDQDLNQLLREHERPRRSPTLERDARKRKRESDSPKQVLHTALRSGLRNSASTGSLAGLDDPDTRSPEYETRYHNDHDAGRKNSHIVKLTVRRQNGHGDDSDEDTSPKVEFASEGDDLHMGPRRSTRHESLSRARHNDGHDPLDGTSADAPIRKQLRQIAAAEPSDDEESVEMYTPRKSSRRSKPIESGESEEDGPVRDTRRLSRRVSATRVKTRAYPREQSDEDEYIDGELSEEGEDILSDDSLGTDPDNIADFVEDDERPRRKQRQSRHASSRRAQHVKSRKRVSRAIRSDEDFSDGSSPTDLQAELQELRPEGEERRRELRDRTNRPDYAIPPPFTDQMLAAPASTRKKEVALRTSFRSLYPEYGSLGLGIPSDNKTNFGNFGQPTGLQSDTDSSDEEGQTSKTAAKAVASALLPAMRSMDQSGGGPSNLGRIKGSNLADADPIGIDKAVSFESVGGLQDHIDQLKEMVSLPLLYPEIFERFHITPPRGVLFHGPPGTGKTLMARALAASCSSEGRKIAFYMRKGADCLSKWVGEAERQLRLLFDEAKANQPSIIFFDEIDGLAPVRSAKQDQIHASIVSTLLALMDGMDARGQVVVIGATNRPDSVDPALRRPGRFDREFYFPLPPLEARSQILSIHTSKWNPPLDHDYVEQLAIQTKGYGGADLRALCTEAALNAVQRRYPQIYMSSEKLVIDPTTISVVPGDFTTAINKIIPSSARSSTSGAVMLPKHLEPLLRDSLSRITTAIDTMIPRTQTKTGLQKNLYTDSSTSTFEQENMRQMLQNMRTYRPRVLVSGPVGHGQQHLGRAVLHYLEGYHVQNIDIAMMFSDSASTAEASIIQAFVEARRHKPSILFMPYIDLWFQTASESVISTLRSLLSTIGSNEPLLLLAFTDNARSQLPARITDFFGRNAISNIELEAPTDNERSAFFNFLASHITKSPADFPGEDTGPMRKLEVLAVAPPSAPREQTKAERKAIEAKDKKTKLVLKARLGPLMELIRTRYKRFKKPAIDEKQIAHLLVAPDQETPLDLGDRDYERSEDGMILENSTGKKYYNMDINLIEERLWNNLYLSPKQFQSDIEQILYDAQQESSDRERLLKAQEMHTNVLIHLEEMFDTSFLEECKSMALREVARHQKFMDSSPPKEVADIAASTDIAQVVVETPEANAENTTINGTGQPTNQAQIDPLDDIATRNGNILDNRPEELPHDFEMTDHASSVATMHSQEIRGMMQLSQMMNHEIVEPHVAENSTETQPAEDSRKFHIAQEILAIEPCAEMSDYANSLVPPINLEAQDSGITPTVIATQPETQDESEPTIEHAPYQLDTNYLADALKQWAIMTAGFNVDQLEQLNSCAVDSLWRHRMTWDRNVVLRSIDSCLKNISASISADLEIGQSPS